MKVRVIDGCLFHDPPTKTMYAYIMFDEKGDLFSARSMYRSKGDAVHAVVSELSHISIDRMSSMENNYLILEVTL